MVDKGSTSKKSIRSCLYTSR